MANFREFDNPTFDPGEVDVEDDPLISPDISLGDLLPLSRQGQERADVSSAPVPLQQELLQSAVDDYYTALPKQGITPALGRDTARFELVNGWLCLKAYPNLEIVNTRTGKPLSLATIWGHGEGKAMRENLGLMDCTRQGTCLPAQATTALWAVNQELIQAAAVIDIVQLQDLEQTVKEASDAVHKMETTFTVAELDNCPLDLRELRGLDRGLQTIQGELTNNLAKLSELDDDIDMEKQKLDEADSGGVDKFTRCRIAEHLRDLQDERASCLEATSAKTDRPSAPRSAAFGRPSTTSFMKTPHWLSV